MDITRKKPIVVLYFLAHDGVFQPGLWELWRKITLCYLLSSCEILFRVHSAQTVSQHPEFCETYAIRNPQGQRIPFGKTRWCETSIPWQFIKGLHYILQEPVIQQATDVKICLLSGHDIPFKNGVKVFQKPFFKTDDICWINKEKWTTHSQWIGITKPTAVLIDEFFHEDLATLKELIKSNLCPDESFLHLDLYTHSQKRDKLQQHLKHSCTPPVPNSPRYDCIIQDRLRSLSYFSPVEYTGQTSTRRQVLHNVIFNYWTIKTSLLYSACSNYNNRVFSFRKVGSVDFSDEDIHKLFVETLWNPRVSFNALVVQFNNQHDNECIYMTAEGNFRRKINSKCRVKNADDVFFNAPMMPPRVHNRERFKKILKTYFTEDLDRLSLEKTRQLEYDHDSILRFLLTPEKQRAIGRDAAQNIHRYLNPPPEQAGTKSNKRNIDYEEWYRFIRHDPDMEQMIAYVNGVSLLSRRDAGPHIENRSSVETFIKDRLRKMSKQTRDATIERINGNLKQHLKKLFNPTPPPPPPPPVIYDDDDLYS